MWWLSYADEKEFRGATLIKALDFLEAVSVSNILKLSPGGEVQGVKIPPEISVKVPEKWIERLLTKEECEELDTVMEELLDITEEKAD